jgi:membrane protein DedA with SNARE-associated domain
MPYQKFLLWNASGGLAWGTAVVLLGYAAGVSYAQAERTMGGDVAAVGLVVVVCLVVWRISARRHRPVRSR